VIIRLFATALGLMVPWSGPRRACRHGQTLRYSRRFSSWGRSPALDAEKPTQPTTRASRRGGHLISFSMCGLCDISGAAARLQELWGQAGRGAVGAAGSGFTLLFEALVMALARRCRFSPWPNGWRTDTGSGAWCTITWTRREAERITRACEGLASTRRRAAGAQLHLGLRGPRRQADAVRHVGQDAATVTAFGADFRAHGGACARIRTCV